ncbi:MAG: response regulator transcription factor [Acidobacteria bacterium]|jgi:DNA-binding LytR/AlgR family response regulator|nr:response regulator transcription factor [Acidobacteriota bacterium]
MKINCIIVEDEPLALERTKEYVLKLPFLNLHSTFDNAIDALSFLKTNHIDLIFLDINLGEFSGIQLLETSAVSSQVILTTAYQEYALKGFDLKVADYLLKPFTFERFVQAVDRVQGSLPKKQLQLPKNFIFVKTENRLEKILLREIIYIEGMRDYRRIHTVGKRIMTLQTFTEFERQIPPNIVCRVHKSYMISLDKIDSIEKSGIKIKDQIIPISETYRQRFFSLINHPAK